MRVNGVVQRIEDGYAWVDVSVAQGCGRCQEPGGCGGVNIAKPFGSSSRAVRVRNEINARPGEQVGVVVEDGVPLRGGPVCVCVSCAGPDCGRSAGDGRGVGRQR